MKTRSKSNKTNSKTYREKLANEFIKVLETENLNWKQGWKNNNKPYNPITGTEYKGVNFFNLSLLSKIKGYDDPRWVTYAEIIDKEEKYHKGEKWHLQKGSKAAWIEFAYPISKDKKEAYTWKDLDEENLEESDFYIGKKYYMVFNASCVTGMPKLEKNINKDIENNGLIINLAKNMGVGISFDGGDNAFYRLSEDKIYLPQAQFFNSQYEFDVTMLHELAHSTGHKSRLNRDLNNKFGSKAYAYEELIAEMSSCFMTTNFIDEIPKNHLKNHQAYVQSWISIIKNDPNELIKAITSAMQVAKYLDNHIEINKEKKKESLLEKAPTSKSKEYER